MMLLIGMWISLTKNPMNPIIQKPIAVAIAIFWNSENNVYYNKSNQHNTIDILLVQLSLQLAFTHIYCKAKNTNYSRDPDC